MSVDESNGKFYLSPNGNIFAIAQMKLKLIEIQQICPKKYLRQPDRYQTCARILPA
jgi:hypothetical protein